jgi:hypothetical protein
MPPAAGQSAAHFAHYLGVNFQNKPFNFRKKLRVVFHAPQALQR